jgi:hypothetical protein
VKSLADEAERTHLDFSTTWVSRYVDSKPPAQKIQKVAWVYKWKGLERSHGSLDSQSRVQCLTHISALDN